MADDYEYPPELIESIRLQYEAAKERKAKRRYISAGKAKWQKIEHAPKTGDIFYLLFPPGEVEGEEYDLVVVMGRWNTEGNGGWEVLGYDDCRVLTDADLQPTHWMVIAPLPKMKVVKTDPEINLEAGLLGSLLRQVTLGTSH